MRNETGTGPGDRSALGDWDQVLDSLPVSLSTWDSSVRNMSSNRVFADWFGTTPHDVVGRHLGDLLPTDVYDRVLPLVTGALDGVPGELDLPMFGRDGNLRHLNVSFSPIQGHEGVLGFSIMGADHTARVRAQQAEQRSAHEVATYLERERFTERLHQEALQQLFAAMLVLGGQVKENPALARVAEGVESAIEDLRGLSEDTGWVSLDAEESPRAPWKVRELVELLDQLPAAVAFWDNDQVARFTNATANLWLGHSRATARGLSMREFLGESLYAANLPMIQAALEGREQQFVRTLGSGSRGRVVQFQYVPNRVHGVVDGFFVLGTDLSELVAARSTLTAAQADVDRFSGAYLLLAQANQAILRARDEDELFAEVCRISVECGGYLGAWVGREVAGSDHRAVEVVTHAGALDAYVAQLDITADADDPRGRGPTGTALREGRPVYSENFQSDPNTAPWRPAAVTHGIAASATIPLRCGDELVAVLNLYSRDVAHFSKHMRTLMEGLADNVSYALTSLEDRRRLRALTAEG